MLIFVYASSALSIPDSRCVDMHDVARIVVTLLQLQASMHAVNS